MQRAISIQPSFDLRFYGFLQSPEVGLVFVHLDVVRLCVFSSDTLMSLGVSQMNSIFPSTRRQPARISPNGVLCVATKESTPSRTCGLKAIFLKPGSSGTIPAAYS